MAAATASRLCPSLKERPPPPLQPIHAPNNEQVLHCWAGLPAGSPAASLLSRMPDWGGACIMMLADVVLPALEACKGHQSPRLCWGQRSLATPRAAQILALQHEGCVAHSLRIIGTPLRGMAP